MKKVSISLFAVIAVLFAVTSAFTTSKKATFDPDYFKAFYIDGFLNGTSDPESSVTNTQADALEGGFIDDESTDFDLPGGLSCITPEEFELCAVVVAYESGNPHDSNIRDFQYGTWDNSMK